MHDKKLLGSTLVRIALLSAVFAIVCFFMGTGDYETYITYGGDAYTGMQNASAQAANNVKALAEIVSMGFGALFLIISSVLFALGKYYGGKVLEKKKIPEAEQTPAVKQHQCPCCRALIPYGIEECPSCHQLIEWPS